MSEELSREDLLKRYKKQPVECTEFIRRRSPFKFLDSYGVDDVDIFFGRDFEIEELLRHYQRHGHVLIYGESGAGKSSLVQCGLRSRIPSEDALFLAPRVHASGLPDLCHQIYEAAGRALGVDGEGDAVNLVGALQEVRDFASRPIVLFFDQFEELFIFHDAETRARFAHDLAAIRRERLNVKVIIGVRQDYLAHLSELEGVVEGLFDNRFWLRRMSRENAAEAVVKACEVGSVGIEPMVATAILERLDPVGMGVELPYLQVVMDRLFRQAVQGGAGQPLIKLKDVEELGDVANILGAFLVEEVGKLPSPDTGRQILKAFVSSEGTRRSLDLEAVATEAAGFGAEIPAQVLDEHLQQLIRVRILRELADTDSYELRHDALAATVAGWISGVEKELIEVRDNVINRFREYEARGRPRGALLDRDFVNYLSVYESRLEPLLTEDQRRFIEASHAYLLHGRRNMQLLIGSIVFVLFIIAYVRNSAYVRNVTSARDKADEERIRAQKAEAEAMQMHQKAELLLTEGFFEKGSDGIQEGNYNRALFWFQASFDQAVKAKSERLQKSARRLLGAWAPLLGDPVVHDERINAVAFSPDGQRIITGSSDDTAAIWDAPTQTLLARLSHTEEVDAVVFSPNGLVAATGCWDGYARLWDGSNGEALSPPLRLGAPVTSLIFTPDSEILLTLARTNTVILWEVHTGDRRHALSHADTILAMALSPDGNTIATASADNTARLWDLQSGQPKGRPMRHGDDVTAIAFSPDGQIVLTGGADKTARFWSAHNGSPMGEPIRHPHAVKRVEFAHHGDRAMTTTVYPDNSVWQWDPKTGMQIGVRLKHPDLVLGATYSLDDKHILTAGRDLAARIWDVAESREVVVMRHDGPVSMARFHPRAMQIVTSSSDHTARIWNFRYQMERRRVLSCQQKVWSAAYSTDGQSILIVTETDQMQVWNSDGSLRHSFAHGSRLNAGVMNPVGTVVVSAGDDDKARRWDAVTGDQLLPHLDHRSAVKAVAVSPDGKFILTGALIGEVKLWDLRTGELRQTLDQRGQSIRTVGFNDDGTMLLAAGNDRAARVWRLQDDGRWGDQPIRTVAHRRPVVSFDFSPDGTQLLTGSEDDTASLWDIQSEGPALMTMPHNDHVNSVVFSPDGRFGLTGSSDNTAKLWDLAARRRFGPPLYHWDEVYQVAFSPDGTTMLTGSADHTARLWDVGSGEPVAEFLHENEVQSVTFSPDGRFVLTGSEDGTARIWDVPASLDMDGKELKILVELKTVRRLDDDGIPRLLSQQEWLERKAELVSRLNVR